MHFLQIKYCFIHAYLWFPTLKQIALIRQKTNTDPLETRHSLFVYKDQNFLQENI